MMILTPSGYVDASTLLVGDSVVGFDLITNESVTNTITSVSAWTAATDPDNQGNFDFYLINGTHNLYKNQSVVDNNNVVHAFEVNVGDTIYDANGNLVTVSSVVQDTYSVWYRFEISGNHTYVADNILLHNASRFWVGGGASANWNATANTNWSASSGGSNNASVPGAADSVTFDGAGASGNTNSTISVNITILSFTNTTGYTHTITFTGNLTVAGSVTTATGILFSGAGALIMTTTGATYTSGGVTMPQPLQMNNAITVTLSGNMSVSGLFTHTTGTLTLSQTTTETLTLTGGITVTNIISGAVPINLNGGTWSGGSSLENNVTIAGNITVSGNVNYGANTLTYSSGTVTTTSSTLNISLTGTTLNTNGITWNNVTFSGAATTTTLTSNMACSGLLTYASNEIVNHTTAETVTSSGGLTMTAGSGNGSATIILTGGTWSGAGSMHNPLNLQGNVTVSGSVAYGNSTLTYVSGTITTTSSTITFNAACSIDTPSPVLWNNITFNAAVTYTLLDNLNCSGLLTLGLTTNPSVINGLFTMTTSGGLTQGTTSGNLTGTASVDVTGGTITGAGITNIGTYELTTTVAGNVTWTNYFVTGNTTWTISSGTQTFNTGAGFYFRMNAGNFTLTNNTAVITGVGAKFDSGAHTCTFNGSFGITFSDFNILLNVAAALVISLLQTNTYKVTTTLVSSLTVAPTTATYPTIESSSGGNKVNFTLLQGATQHLERIDFTDIDNSLGQTIWDYSPNTAAVTLTDTLNINTTPTTPNTVAFAFVA